MIDSFDLSPQVPRHKFQTVRIISNLPYCPVAVTAGNTPDAFFAKSTAPAASMVVINIGFTGKQNLFTKIADMALLKKKSVYGFVPISLMRCFHAFLAICTSPLIAFIRIIPVFLTSIFFYLIWMKPVIVSSRLTRLIRVCVTPGLSFQELVNHIAPGIFLLIGIATGSIPATYADGTPGRLTADSTWHSRRHGRLAHSRTPFPVRPGRCAEPRGRAALNFTGGVLHG